METRDWSLVVFTVLTQAAVGAFLTLQVLRHLTARRDARHGALSRDTGPGASRARGGARNDRPAAGHTRDDGPGPGGARDGGPESGGARNPGRRPPVPLVVVLAVLSAGLSAALFHLSTPLQAARAVVNFSSSWLSREIVFGSLFAGLLGALAMQEWRSADWALSSPARERRAPAGRASANPTPATSALAAWLPGLTAAAGLTFLGCQVAIYLLPAQPAWNSLATPAAFGGTALRLGVLGVAAGLAVRSLAPEVVDPTARRGRMPPATLRGLALAGIAALALEFVFVPLHLASLTADPLPAAAASADRLTDVYGGVLLLRLGLLGAAAVALGGVLAIVRGLARPSRQRLTCALACGAFGLVVVSEICGRFLFYAMQVRVGI